MPRGLRAVSTTGLAVLIGLAAAGVALPAARDPERLPVTRVQDLHYGDVLFYFYQDESFEALTRLEAYGQWQRMPHHDAEAALLAGGLYLQLGMHNEAGKRFETLLGPGIPAGVRNRAWFYLAKVWYARGYYDKAEQSLAQIQGRLVAALEAERQHLLANTLMRLGRFDDAIRLLQGWHGPADWMAYARFNLGVALVRSGRTAEADPFLTQAGTFETSREELLALKDKANLALGYAWLQANEPAKAKLALERVRLDGSQSTRALLGAGWADAALEQYRDALGPWLELHGRDMLDAAVQESFLAVPYAFAKLNANAQASEYYEQAIRSFDEESQRIDAAVGRIESGNMLEGLLAAEPREAAVAGPRGNGWFWQLEQLPDAPESRYLYALLADNDFQEGLKNYRDLRYLGGTLARWDDNMSAYGNMLEARETSFAQELPRTDALLASERLQRLESGRTALDTRLAEVVAARDVAGLGTPEERQQWRKIQALEQELATRPEDAETTALRDKLRLAKGVLFFRLDADYKQRLVAAAPHAQAARRRARGGAQSLDAAAGSAPASRRRPPRASPRASRLCRSDSRACGRISWPPATSRMNSSSSSRCASCARSSSGSTSTACRRALRSPPSTTAPPTSRRVALRRRRPSRFRSSRRLRIRRGAGRDSAGGGAAMSMRRCVAQAVRAGILCAGTLAVSFVPGPVLAAGAAAPTLKDLQKKNIDVRPEAKVPAGAGRAMENYRRFLELQRADPAQRAEALRRLGDLSLEAGELERMENEVTRIDLAGAEAIQLYTTLLKAHPDYPRNDQVLYQLARAYETTGQPEKALATLDDIVLRQGRGNSRVNAAQLAEVQFRRGEILFSAQRYKDAENAYGAVLEPAGGAAPAVAGVFYQQSLYKHGWALFKQSLNDESLVSFGELLDLKLTQPGRAGEARALDTLARADREMVEDTLRVMSIAFSYTDGADALDKFVASRGATPYSHLIYSRLGDLYVDKQRFQDGAATYRAFVNREPNSEFAPALSMQAIEAYRKGGFAQLMLDGKREYVEHYNFDTAFWQGKDRARYPTVVAELKTNLKDVAEYYHATAQKSKRPEDYGQAVRWYRAMLASFPDDPQSAQSNYLLADALFESHQYADAVTEYERTAYGYPPSPRSAAAAYAGLAAYQRYEAQLAAGARAPWHARSVDAGLRFATAFPQHPDSTGVLTRAAEDLYAAKDLPRAAQAAEQLLAHQPPAEAPRRRIAYALVGQVAFDGGDFAKAESSWIEARRLTAPKDAEQANLTERIAVSVYRQGEAKNKAGDGAAAIEDFLRVGRVAPDSPIRATAQYDAAAALLNLKEWTRAIDVLEAYRKEYPQTEYAADITRKLAIAYQEGGRPRDAAGELERIAANSGEGADVRREALARSAEMYAAAGDQSRSVTQLEKFVKDYPRPLAESMETRQRLAELAEKSGNTERLRYWQREIVKADSGAGSERSDRTKFLAARSQLALAAPARDAFNGVAARGATQGLAHRQAQVARDGAAGLQGRGGVQRRRSHHRGELRDGRALPASRERPHGFGTPEAPVGGRARAVRPLARGAGIPVRGAVDQAARGKRRAGARRPIRRISAEELRGARAVEAGSLCKTELSSAPAQYGGALLDPGVTARNGGFLEESEKALAAETERVPTSAAAWNELGITLRQRGKFQEAQTAYEKALAIDPTAAAPHRNLGVLRDLYLDDAQSALPELERYREITGEDKPITGWIADLRQRLGIREPRPEAAPATDAAPPADAPATPAAPVAPNTTPAAPAAPAEPA